MDYATVYSNLQSWDGWHPYEVVVEILPKNLVDLGKIRGPEVAVAVAIVLVKDVSNVCLEKVVAAVAAQRVSDTLSSMRVQMRDDAEQQQRS